ncbi:MAG: alpha-glycosidase [Halanaerobiales bacterium]|nr:alpha-glycosidase [Halanaerobiales bacterium]
MNKAAVYHESIANFTYPLDDQTLRIKLITAKNDLKRATIIYGPKFDNYKDPFYNKEMKVDATDQTHDYFGVKIKLSDPRFRYHFLLEDYQDNKYWYNEKGFFKNRPRGHESGFFQFPIITEWEKFKRPEWFNKAVIYQIFPDRFFNSNKSSDPNQVTKWGKLPDHDSFYGGDLEGIIKKLDYIADLGIDTIYLTPIFESKSNHKYNIKNYLKIDQQFGDLDTLKELVNALHQKDMKIILDAVFNHCDINFFAFQDLINYGEKSKYKDWFIYQSLPIKTDYPINYTTFATQEKSMPKLNTDNPEVQDYLLEVVEYWMTKIKIDGWRLDVADEVNMDFWSKFRKKVKSINPKSVIIGEIWHSAKKWLRGDRFDTVMNYPFNWAVINFFGSNEIGVDKFSSLIIKNYYHYREDTSNTLLNLLSSHDIPRIYEYCKTEKQLKLAILFLLTFPGTPMIYYGDELGLKGGEDPDNRRCMPWDRVNKNNNILSYYKKIIRIRNKLNPLSLGDFHFILKDEAKNTVVFKRRHKNKTIYIAINNSHISQNIEFIVNQCGKYKDILNENILKTNNKSLPIKLKPFEGKIITCPLTK